MMELLLELQPALGILAGGLTGYLSSFILWRRTREDQRKERIAAQLRKGIELSLRSGNFLRALIYAKRGGIEEVAKLGPDPMDELIALTTLHVPDPAVGLIVQEMHFIIQKAFASRIEEPGVVDFLLNTLTPRYVELINRLNRKLTEVAKREKLEEARTKEQIAEWEAEVANLERLYH